MLLQSSFWMYSVFLNVQNDFKTSLTSNFQTTFLPTGLLQPELLSLTLQQIPYAGLHQWGENLCKTFFREFHPVYNSAGSRICVPLPPHQQRRNIGHVKETTKDFTLPYSQFFPRISFFTFFVLMKLSERLQSRH